MPAALQAKPIDITWYCKNWESHNSHFSAAAHGDWRSQLQAIRYMQRVGMCVYDKGAKGDVMHVIGEVSYNNPGEPESNRRWWQALMVKHENGNVVYFVRQRQTPEGWQ